MRSIISLAALGLFACAPVDGQEAATFVADQAAPPSATLVLTPTSASATIDSPFGFDISGADPGDTILLTLSTGGLGAGECFGFLGGNCMDTVGPYTKVLRLTADASGNAGFATPGIAEGVPVGSYFFQAVASDNGSLWDNESNAVQVDLSGYCPVDGYEVNDTLPGAALPASGFAANTCAAAPDFFTVTVPTATQFDFELLYTHDDNNDVDTTIYENGVGIGGTGGTTGTEAFSYVNQTGAAADLTVEVYSWNGTDGGNGTDWTATYSTTAVVPQIACPDDVNDPDNDWFAAVPAIPAGAAGLAQGPFTSCDRGTAYPDEDIDVWEITLAPGETLDATIAFSDDASDVDLFILDAVPAAATWGDINTAANATLLATCGAAPIDCSGTSVSDDESVSATDAGTGGTYYLVVAMFEDGGSLTSPYTDGADYTLDVTITP